MGYTAVNAFAVGSSTDFLTAKRVIDDDERVGDAMRCQVSTPYPGQSVSGPGKRITPADRHNPRSRSRLQHYVSEEKRSYLVRQGFRFIVGRVRYIFRRNGKIRSKNQGNPQREEAT